MPAEIAALYTLVLVCYAWLLVTEEAWERHSAWMSYRAALARWEGNEND